MNKETAETLADKVRTQFPKTYVHAIPSGQSSGNPPYIVGVHESAYKIGNRECFVLSAEWEWEKVQSILQVLGFIDPVAPTITEETVEASTNN